ncbi:MAG TPA: hypothetical protein VLL52_22310, partial [Anaerolineae bacterium]|nr:hypothetical protein [Anaerolineae bacterium]
MTSVDATYGIFDYLYVGGQNVLDLIGSSTINVVGGGASIHQNGLTSVTGSAFNFRSFVAGANMSIVAAADTLTFSSSGGGGGGTVTEVVPVGAGASLLQGGAVSDVGPVVELRSLVAGAGITITDDVGQPDILTFSVDT